MHKILVSLIVICVFNIIPGQNITKVADSIMAKYNIPEMSFAIITKDSIVLKNTLGHRKITQLAAKPNANINDYFHLGSNTKAITGFIAAYEVEQKKINWDTKFFDLFPELKNKSNSKYLNITLEDLLTHRAKIQAFTSGAEYQKLPKFIGSKKEKREQFAKYVLTLLPVESNDSYNYSNAGYSIASLMLEKVTGKSWEELADKLLNKTLKLDFVFGWPNRNFDNQPFGHWMEDEKATPVPPSIDYNLNLAEPAGDISMNITNYAKFIKLNLHGLSGENNILKSETYHFLHTAKHDYAIGWANFTKDNKQISEHTGSDGTFFSYTQIDRKNLTAYVVLINNASETAQKGVFEMIKQLKKLKEATL